MLRLEPDTIILISDFTGFLHEINSTVLWLTLEKITHEIGCSHASTHGYYIIRYYLQII